MWSNKLFIHSQSRSSSCDDCGWYNGVRVIVKNEDGEVLMDEYGDDHLAGGPMASEVWKTPYILEKAGYGEGWKVDPDYEPNSELEIVSVLRPDESIFNIYIKDENYDDLTIQVLKDLGHEVISTFEHEDEDY